MPQESAHWLCYNVSINGLIMTEVAMKADLAAKEADLQAIRADLKAAIELARLRLTVRLGGILIANLIAVGLLLFATGLLLAP